MDKQLNKNFLSRTYKRSKEHDFSDGIGGTVPVLVVEGKKKICKFWNSSVSNTTFNKEDALAKIAERVIDGDVEGTVSVGFDEIWFELIDKEQPTKDDQLRTLISSELTAAIDNVFIEIHKFAGTDTGDITPEQQIRLDELQEEIGDLMYKQVKQNLADEDA